MKITPQEEKLGKVLEAHINDKHFFRDLINLLKKEGLFRDPCTGVMMKRLSKAKDHKTAMQVVYDQILYCNGLRKLGRELPAGACHRKDSKMGWWDGQV